MTLSRLDALRFHFWTAVAKACLAVGWPTGAIGAIACAQRIVDGYVERTENK